MPIATPLSLSLHPPLASKSTWTISPSPSRSRFPAAVLGPFIRNNKTSHSPSHSSSPLPPTISASSTARPGEDLTNFIWDHQSIPDDSRPRRSHWEHEQALAEVARFYNTLIQRSPPPPPRPPGDPVFLPHPPPSPPMSSSCPRSPATTAATAFCRRLQPRLSKTCTRDHQSSSGKCSASCSSDSSVSEIYLSSSPLTQTISGGGPSLPRRIPQKSFGLGPTNISSAPASADLHGSSHHGSKSSAGSSEPEAEVDLESDPEALESRTSPRVLADVPLRTSSIRHTRSLGRLKAGRTKISKKNYVIFNRANLPF